MEILFKNIHTRDKKIAKELYAWMNFKRKSAIFFYILVALSLLMNCVSAVLGGEANAVYCALALSFALFPVIRYFQNVKLMVARDVEAYGKELEVETEVTDEYIQTKASSGAVSRMRFDRIKTVAQTKNLILLLTKANMVHIFKKDSFSIGSADEFIAFLKNKGFKI